MRGLLLPSAIEIVCQLGLGNNLVGATHKCRFAGGCAPCQITSPNEHRYPLTPGHHPAVACTRLAYDVHDRLARPRADKQPLTPCFILALRGFGCEQSRW